MKQMRTYALFFAVIFLFANLAAANECSVHAKSKADYPVVLSRPIVIDFEDYLADKNETLIARENAAGKISSGCFVKFAVQ